MKKSLEEGQIVLCTVDRIIGTIVFVKIDDYNLEGAITFSEISPGRIRNIRDYVFSGKKIVCKILRIKPQGIDLSLRRVKLKEKNELNEINKKEKGLGALLKTIVGEKSEWIVKRIKEEEESFTEFLDNIKNDYKVLAKYISEDSAKRISKSLQDKKAKEEVLRKRFLLSNKGANGMLVVKEIIKQAREENACENCEVVYTAAGDYTIKIRTKNLKEGNSHLNRIMGLIENLAKKKSCSFTIISEK